MAALNRDNSLIVAFLYAALAPIALGASGASVVYFLPVMASAAEDTAIEPKLSCHLGGFVRTETEKGESRTDVVEKKPDGTYVSSNWTGLSLDVRLDGGNLPVHQLEIMHSESRPPPSWEETKRATVEVTIDSISENEKDIPFFISSSGGGGESNTAYVRLHLRLPRDEAEKRKEAEEYFHRLINSNEPDDPRIRRLLEREESIIGMISSLSLQNRAGVYRISCSYSSEKGPWVGTVRAKPLILRIVFEKAFLDLEVFRLNSNEE